MDDKTIWIYKFKDGTKLKVLEKGLSDAEVRKLEELHGAWIEHTVDIKRAAWVGIDQEPHEVFECNACGFLIYGVDRDDFKFCPSCGAKME